MGNPYDDRKLQWRMPAQPALLRAVGSVRLPLGARGLVGEALDLALDALCAGPPPL